MVEPLTKDPLVQRPSQSDDALQSLIARLRKIGSWKEGEPAVIFDSAIFLEAADALEADDREIERLIALHDDAWKKYNEWRDRAERLKQERDEAHQDFLLGAIALNNLTKERDRLRGALERIAANDHMTSAHSIGPAMGAGVNQGLAWNARLAREALAEHQGNT